MKGDLGTMILPIYKDLLDGPDLFKQNHSYWMTAKWHP